MKEDLAFKQSKRLGHTRQHFDIFNFLANWAVDEAGGSSKVFGSKPGVADYRETDLGTEANRAVKSNTANYDDILALLEKINPGYGARLKQGGKNTDALLRGEIPEDVQQAVKRSAAFRSLSGGYAGSGMSKALTARDFGRTSLDLMQAGNNSAQQWEQIAQGASAPFIVTAPAQAEATFKNNVYKQAVDQFKLNVLAAPDPGAAGMFSLGGGGNTGLGRGANPNAAAASTGGWGSGGGSMQQGANAGGSWWGGGG